jgi:hypothetical protein
MKTTRNNMISSMRAELSSCIHAEDNMEQEKETT